MKEISIEELPNYKGKSITFQYSDGRKHTNLLEDIREIKGEKSLVFKLKRKDKWDGIEMIAEIPTQEVNVYINE